MSIKNLILEKEWFRKLSFIFFVLVILSVSLIFVSLANSSPTSAYGGDKTVAKNHASNDFVEVNSDVSKKMANEGVVDVIIMFDEVNTDVVSTDMLVDSRTDSIGTKDKKTRASSRVLSNDVIEKKDSNEVISNVKGFNKKHDLNTINGYSGTLTVQGLEELKAQAEQNGLNVKVFENRYMQVHSSSLSISTAAVNANYSHNVLNITGRGVKVAIIDTGVNYTLPELGGCFGNGTNASCKVFDGYNILDDSKNIIDDDVDQSNVTRGHGTHVAGILAASGSITGVAPNTTLIILKACDRNGGCWEDNVITAMDLARDTYNASIISLSLGYNGINDIGNIGKDPFSLEIDKNVDLGMIVVVSAGNSGPAVSTITIPGASESAITVGAINDYNTTTLTDDDVWSKSSRGPGLFGRLDPDIVTPGYGIESILRSGVISPLTGTSMSTAFVSGAAALLLEQNSNLTPAEVRTILIQSTNYVSGKVFERGAGVLDIRNALTSKVYANVFHIDPYGRARVNERWEFVVTPYTTEYANITLINNNNYNITFNVIIENITNLENDSITLNTAQIGIPSSINASNNSNNYTFQINFTLINFSNAYATTYGGIILLNGSGNNGTANVTKTIRIPVIITIPIMNYGYLSRTMYNVKSSSTAHDYDTYNYCYYNAKSRNPDILINWTTATDDLDLYIYNSTGDSDVHSDMGGTNYEENNTLKNDSFKWFKINGYKFVSPITFNIDISELGNNAPSITTVIPVNGSINSTNVLLFNRPNDIIINVSYYDVDNDNITLTLNDSSYAMIEQDIIDASNGYVVFKKNYSSSIIRNSTISLRADDPYGASFNQSVTILMYGAILLEGYSPSNSLVYVKQNNLVEFSVNASEVSNKTLYYYWSANGTIKAIQNNTLNVTQNYIFNDTNCSSSHYIIRVAIYNNYTNNNTNETQSWDVYIDGLAPIITIVSPANNTVYAQSKININYTVNDTISNVSSGIGLCWYSIGLLGNYSTNTSLSSCTNASEYLANGNYSIIIYANDTVGNLGFSTTNFSVNDTTSPTILTVSPEGAFAHTHSVTLSISTDEYSTCKYDSNDVDYDSMSGVFTDNITEHTALYSVDTGSYTIFARCRDLSNNTDNMSDSIAFVINAPTSSGGSPNSGSSVGRNSNYNSDFYSSTILRTFSTLPKGETNLSIYSNNIPFSQINIYSKYNLSDVKLNIIKTDVPESYYGYYFNMNDTNMSNVQQITEEEYLAAEKYYYQEKYAYVILNMSFDKNNLSQLLDTDTLNKFNLGEFGINDILKTQIYFSVTNKWITDNNISQNDIVLLKYNENNNTWEEISAELLNSANNLSYYVASSTGLGLYSISHNKTFVPPASKGISDADILESLNKSINRSEMAVVHSGENNTLKGIKTSDNFNNALSSIFNSIKESLTNNSQDWSWIIAILFSTFIFVLVAMIVIRHHSIKHYERNIEYYKDQFIQSTEKSVEKAEKSVRTYEDQLITSTEKEFKNASTELSKKIPDVSKTIRKELVETKSATSANTANKLPSSLVPLSKDIQKKLSEKVGKELSEKMGKELSEKTNEGTKNKVNPSTKK